MTTETATSAADAWKERVETHHAQSLRVMDDSLQHGDFWRSLAPMFRADPHRTDDEALDAISALVDPDSTVLDVGGGAGKYAVALAFKSSAVTVVEPSESMLEQLNEAAEEAGCSNVEAVFSEWETANVPASDTVLCSHVVYGVAEIVPFIAKLNDHAKRRVILLSFVDSPQSGVAQLWEPVHGEPRINLPAMPELVNVLWGMDIYPDIRMLTTTRSHRFDDVAAALDEFKRRLFIGRDQQAEQRLEDCIEVYLESTPDGYRIKGARPTRQGLITWTT